MKSHVHPVQVVNPSCDRIVHRSITRRGNVSFARDLRTGSSYDTASLSTMVLPLLNYQLKSHAFDILRESIRSVGDIAISNCVYSIGGKSGHQTWGLCSGPASVSKVLSTLVFRKFRKLEFVELTYVATAAEYRRDGFGSFLLDSMLKLWHNENIAYVFTFADSGAVKFFERKGFSREIPVPRDLYDCWIDKYSHSTFMCCRLNFLHMPRSPSNMRIEVLVYIENITKHAKEKWVKAVVVSEDESFVHIQYCVWLRNYFEVLSWGSFRLRLAE